MTTSVTATHRAQERERAASKTAGRGPLLTLRLSLPASLSTLAVAALALLAGCSTLPGAAVDGDGASAPAVAAAPAGALPKVTDAEIAEMAPTVSATSITRSRLDPADDAARVDLWARVRSGFAMPELDNELVRKWEQWYATRPDYVQRMTTRGGRYMFHIVEELQRRDMPFELALLPFVESAFNPQAQSTARASGMWQFMPLTGKDFELRQNLFRDDRRDVLASTRAALDYLQRLHDQFGDWQLALAAYNWGQGNVQRAVQRNKAAGLPADYDNLRLPDETRNYLPKLQAVKNIVLRPQAFALVLPELVNHPYFLSVTIERDIDVAIAARLADLSLDDFQQLNPQMNKPVILAAGTPQVLLPYDNANRFVQQLQTHRGPLASWTAWTAPKTLTPAEAARQIGIGEAQLRDVNHIPPKMLVRQGSTLLVPRGAHVTLDVAGPVADNGVMVLAPEPPPLRKVSFRAGKKGDTVAAVARRWRVAPAQVAQWNGVAAASAFKPGQTIVVMQPVAAAKARGAGSTMVALRSAQQRQAGTPKLHAHVHAQVAGRHRVARAATAVTARAGGGKAAPSGKSAKAAAPPPRIRVAQR